MIDPNENPEVEVAGGESESEFASELVAGSGGGRKLNMSFVLMAILLAAAGGGLYSMRMLGASYATDRIGENVGNTIDDYRNSVAKRTPDENNSTVLAVLELDPTQVPPQNLAKNPFVIAEIDKEQEEEVVVVVDPGETEAERMERRRTMIQDAGRLFEVTTIVGGSNPLAIVDGQVVKLGDTVESDDWEFTIEAIGSDDGVTFVLDDLILKEKVRVTRTIERDL